MTSTKRSCSSFSRFIANMFIAMVEVWICRGWLVTVTRTLRPQGCDIWQFLERAWIAHHPNRVMPSLLLDP